MMMEGAEKAAATRAAMMRAVAADLEVVKTAVTRAAPARAVAERRVLRAAMTATMAAAEAAIMVIYG